MTGEKQYFYGVTGGNVYLDNHTKDFLGQVNQQLDNLANISENEQFLELYEEYQTLIDKLNKGETLTQEESERLSNLMMQMTAATGFPELVTTNPILGSITQVDAKTLAGGGNIVIREPETLTLNLKGYEGKDNVRYYGAIGGDTALNLGLNGKISASIDFGDLKDIVKLDGEYTEPEKTVINRYGDVKVNVGSKDGDVSVLGGVGGSAAMAVGNVTLDMTNEDGSRGDIAIAGIPIHIEANVQDLKLQGEAETTIHGSVETVVDKDASVLGWMNGGLAAGVGGKASSTVTGDTTITINGTDSEGEHRDTKPENLGDTVTKLLDVMKGSNLNAVGVLGGGTAVTTLGGEANAAVNGATHININNATVVGAFGGGAAGAMDATDVGDILTKELLGQDKKIGNDNGTSDFYVYVSQLEDENGALNPQIEILPDLNGGNAGKDALHVTFDQVNQGGTATSVTGDTYLNVTSDENGNSTAIGVFGGGAAAASQTYLGKWGDNKGKAMGVSNATAQTGKSHIYIDVNNDNLTDENKGQLATAMGNLVDQLGPTAVDDGVLKDVANKGIVLGVAGGGVAVGFGQNTSAENTIDGVKQGATAVAETAGSEIQLADGYVAGTLGGGVAIVRGNADATAAMTDTVDILVGKDVEAVGVFGNGLAFATGSVPQDDQTPKGRGSASATTQGVNMEVGGKVDGLVGGGVAIDDVQAGAINASATNNGTTSINVYDGAEINTVNFDVLGNFLGKLNTSVDDKMEIADQLQAATEAAGPVAIAGGGVAIGGDALAHVENAVINLYGGTVGTAADEEHKVAAKDGDIIAGGVAVYGTSYTLSEGAPQTESGSIVGKSTVNLYGGTVNGSVYAGGAIANGEAPTEYQDSVSYVKDSTINLAGTSVTGEISGAGYQKTTDGKALYTVDVNGDTEGSGTTSTLNLIGENTLTTLVKEDGKQYTSDYKVHDFDVLSAASGSVTALTGLTANVAGDPGTEGTAVFGNSDGVTTDVDIAADAYLDISNIGGEETTTYNGETYHVGENLGDLWSKDAMIYDRTQYYATTATDDSGSYDITVSKLDENNKADAAESFGNLIEAGPLQPTVDDLFDKGWDDPTLTEGGKQFFEDWSNNPTMKNAYGRAAMIGEDAAVTGNTVSIARDMADNVMQRLSFTDDYVQDAGWVNNDGGIWAKYIHRKYETEGMGSSFGGIRSSTDYDGAIVGVDFAKHGNFQSGVAFHYGSGDGNGLISRNDYDAWGFTLYGSLKDEEAGTNLMADVGYVTSDNDIDGTVNSKSLSADRDVDAWTIGLRGEKEYVFGQNQLVPYVGLRYMSVNPARYSVYYDGAKAFNADADNQNLWLLPIGVSFRNETVTNGGWRITPKLDLSYIWAFGDTDTDMTLDMGGVGSGLYYDVMDDNSWLASLGVEATKDVWSFGVGYGYQKGDDTKNKTWFVNASYAF